MRIKTLAIACAVLVVLAAVVLGVSRWTGGPSSEGRIGKPVLPVTDLGSATRIQIRSHEGTVTLQGRDDGEWVVAEQDGFFADAKKIKELIVKLNSQTVAHKVTEKKEKLGDLGLLTAEENGGKWEKDKTGIDLRILDAQEQPLFGIVIGKDRRGGTSVSWGGTYVRFSGEDAAYLIGETVLTDYRSEDWIDKTVFDEEGDKVVKSIRIRKSGAPEVFLSRDKPEADWTLAGVPADKVAQREIKSLANLIAGMDIYKVAQPGQTDKDLGRSKTGRVEIEFFDKRRFILEIGQEKSKDEYRYMTIRGELDPAVTEPKLKEQIEVFNKRFGNRMLAVYDWDGGQLLQERKDFLVKETKK